MALKLTRHRIGLFVSNHTSTIVKIANGANVNSYRALLSGRNRASGKQCLSLPRGIPEKKRSTLLDVIKSELTTRKSIFLINTLVAQKPLTFSCAERAYYNYDTIID